MQIMGYRSAFTADGYFYPGVTIETKYVNGSNYTTPWLARFQTAGFTGPLETGGDFYNFFVLDLLPASFNESYAQYVNSSNGNSSSNSQQSASRVKRDTSNLPNWDDMGVTSAYPNNPISV